MWLYRSGGIENQIILYDYKKTRSGSCAEEFLEGFSGYHLFEMFANSEVKERDILEKCMPWSENIADELRVKTTK
jgi:hypothetical protein